jgi:hypothetical protein
MSTQKNRPPAGQPFIWWTLEMMESDAWWTLGAGGHRVVGMICLEHMRRGGQHNGRLIVPHRQMIGRVGHPSLIAGHIERAEEVGFIQSSRGGMRVATRYALTWLPLFDGTPASNRWRQYRNPTLRPWSERKKGEGLPHAKAAE